VARAARIAAEICRSLSEAHRLGIIHRDLKPENIFLQTVGTEEMVKVIDFGISHSNESAVSPSGAIFSGTPRYLAPERLRDEPLDARSDVYSLGVMLYEMLCGSVPFASTSMSRLLFMHLSQAPAPLRSVHPDLSIPLELDRLVLQMLAKLPCERPQSVAEVKARLAPWLS
jgi:serine/threonine-protein kinase